MYDYNPNSLNPVIVHLSKLEQKGQAQKFPVHGEKLEKVEAVIIIEDNDVKHSEFKWKNVDKPNMGNF